MKSSHHKPNYTICTVRSFLFHLHQLQPSATSMSYWQRSRLQPHRRMVRFITLWNLFYASVASRLCIKEVWYIAGVSSISEPYQAYHTYALPLHGKSGEINWQHVVYLIISSSTQETKVHLKHERNSLVNLEKRAFNNATELKEFGQDGDMIVWGVEMVFLTCKKKSIM